MNFPRVVYALMHVPSGKVYVGSSHKIVERVRVHINSLKRGDHQNKAMQEDFDRLGGPYLVYVLDVIRDMDDRNKEYIWMDVFHARDPERGYNGKDTAMRTEITKFLGIPFPMDAGEERNLAEGALQGLVDKMMQ